MTTGDTDSVRRCDQQKGNKFSLPNDSSDKPVTYKSNKNCSST